MVEFSLFLTDDEVSSFLEQIHVERTTTSVEFLTDIVTGITEHVPFQNITMLTGPNHRPSNEWIKREMLDGLGGLCTVRNPFLYALLKALGFEVRFVSSTMLEPDCHISLVVRIHGDDWWVDVGNGYPYFSPIQLGDETPQQNWFLSYRLVLNGSRYEVQHLSTDNTWNVNHHFSSGGVDFSVFDHMHKMHYTQPGWGPFLTGLRVNRFWLDGGAIIKDHQASSPTGTEIINGPQQLSLWLEQWFNQDFYGSIDLDAAYERWNHNLEGLE